MLQVTFHETFCAFWRKQNEVNEAQMRQQNSFFFEKKDGCLCVNKPFFLSQWEAFLPWGLFGKTTLQIVPKKDY
jgi:hypothetical protein